MSAQNPTHEPYVTDHLGLRWLSRTRDFNLHSLDTAWGESDPVTIDNRSYDTARFHPDHDVLLLVKGGAITTVLNASNESFERLSTQYRCARCGYTDRVDPDTGCNWCHSTEYWEPMPDADTTSLDS